jgi:hypothetical protein
MRDDDRQLVFMRMYQVYIEKGTQVLVNAVVYDFCRTKCQMQSRGNNSRLKPSKVQTNATSQRTTLTAPSGDAIKTHDALQLQCWMI